MSEAKKPTRAELALLDIQSLLLDQKFLRFLSTIRIIAGIEQTAYGPADRHLHFVEGRRSLWCNILRTAEQAQPDALLRILEAEINAAKETSIGRRKYDRLRTSDDGNSGERDPVDSGTIGDFLDYSAEPRAAGTA